MGKKQRRKASRTQTNTTSAPASGAERPARPPVDEGATTTKAARDPSRRPGTTRKRTRRTSALPWIVGLGGLALLVGITVAVNVMQEAGKPGERFRSQGNVHVALGTQTPAYNSDPPTSGWHTPGLAGWGSYVDEPPHDQQLVHNMEDGGVILWYAAGTREENEAHVQALQDVLGTRWSRTVIVPREGMETTYALTAWTRMQRFDEIDPEGMRAFVDAYHGIDHHPGP